MISKLHQNSNQTCHCWGEEAYIENGAQPNEQIIETEVQNRKINMYCQAWKDENTIWRWRKNNWQLKKLAIHNFP